MKLQKKDLIAKIISLSDDFYLERKFPALRCPSDETTQIFMAHELFPLPKLLKISDNVALDSAPAPASSTDDSDSGSDDSENNLSNDENTEDTETSSNLDLFSNEEVPSIIIPEANVIVPDNVGNENFREWYETLQVRSYNDELLTILPYVIFD